MTHQSHERRPVPVGTGIGMTTDTTKLGWVSGIGNFCMANDVGAVTRYAVTTSNIAHQCGHSLISSGAIPSGPIGVAFDFYAHRAAIDFAIASMPADVLFAHHLKDFSLAAHDIVRADTRAYPLKY